MPFSFESWVGRYRLLVSDELRAFIEEAFVAPAPASEREAVRAEALTEAAAAELEIQTGGTIISRAGDREFYRLRVAVPASPIDALRFGKAPGQSVVLTLDAPGRVLASQPGKPPAVFVRQP